MGEVVRAASYALVPLGLAVAVVPWLLAGATTAGRVNALVVGLAVALLALPRGPKRESYGRWDRWALTPTGATYRRTDCGRAAGHHEN